MARKIHLFALIVLLVFSIQNVVFAESIDNIISQNPAFSPAIIGISVKEQNTGKILYEKNSKTLVHPASTLKIITSSAALDYLGLDYTFRTILYKNINTVYLKLSADPLFTSSDAMSLANQYKSRNTKPIQSLVIDDFIIDKVPYGVGWQWDDNVSHFFPQMSPYVINNNLFSVQLKITDAQTVQTTSQKLYTEKIINNLKVGEKKDIIIERNVFAEDSPVFLNGVIDKNMILSIPAKNPEKLFKSIMIYTFIDNGMVLSDFDMRYGKTPRFLSQEAIISHKITEVLKRINMNSDNLAAEILLKHAGAMKTDTIGTTLDGVSIVKEFYQKNGVNTDKIILADASGVSMNDYVTPDFMTNALIAISKNKNFQTIYETMPDTNNGTFKGRTPQLVGKIKVKTGTLANTSAVVGYLKTNSGNDIVFSIMLDNLPKNLSPKVFEDKIIQAVAQNY